jgi:hypothetical protein
MAVLTHPTMSKGTGPASPGPKPVTQPPIIVEDLSQFESGPEPQQVQEPVQASKSLLVEEERKKLDDLIFLGKVSKEVDLAGHRFEVATLTHKEHTALMAELSEFAKASEASLFVIRAYTMAFVLKRIDGVRIDDIKTEGEFKNPFAKRLDLIDNMQLRVIEKLYEEYSVLSDESDKIVTSDNLKKS